MGALTFASTRTAFGQTAANNNKLVIVILRGALDGLAAVPKLDDPHIRALRKDLVPENALPLGDGFALHPSLETVHQMFGRGEASVLHAVAGPYRDRSHFLAQDLLEAGTQEVVSSDGWLNRALQVAPQPMKAVSIGPSSPLILRGNAAAATWSPPTLPEADEDTVARLMTLYERDELLGSALRDAVALSDITGGDMKTKSPGDPALQSLSGAGRLLSAPGGPDIAVVPIGGWDTHANQSGILTNRLRQLDRAIDAMKQELGSVWQTTAVAIVTEFGRTARQNGTRGSDHGTAGTAIMVGGAISGGKVLGDWPGLGAEDLYESRDLKATTDLRSLFKGLLMQQFGFDPKTLGQRVFPDSQTVRSISV